MRRGVYDRAGWFMSRYSPEPRWGLLLQMFEEGFRIVLPDGRPGSAYDDEETRPSDRWFCFHTRAYLWTAAKDYSMIAGVRFLAMKFSMMPQVAMYPAHRWAYSRGLRPELAGIRAVLRDRMPGCRGTLRYVGRREQSPASRRRLLLRDREAVQL